MRKNISTLLGFVPRLAVLALMLLMSGAAQAADHGDTPLLIAAGRHDARIAGVFAFVRGENLVVIVTTDPTIPPGEMEYAHPPDLTITIYIDNNSAVSFEDQFDLDVFGGTIVRPKRIKEDIRFRLRFEEDGSPELHIRGLPGPVAENVIAFTGLRDDPFIRGPRIGRNIAAVVLELPLEDVLNDQDTLLIWATTKVPDIIGPFQDLGGRALRSMFMENDAMNTLPPKDHTKMLDVAPDVVIFNTYFPAAFPNGRELTDDVLDLVGDPRPLANDDPCPDENDVPFLDEFPYLAPPQDDDDDDRGRGRRRERVCV